MMGELFVFNQDYEVQGILQNPISYTYTEQLRGRGEFQIVLPVTDENKSLSAMENIVLFDVNGGIAGIIKKSLVQTSADSSPTVNVTGYLVNEYLYRRICWGLYTASGKPLEVATDMVNKQVINPSSSDRAIADIIAEEPDDVGEKISYQNTGGNVGEALESICSTIDAGFYLRYDIEKRSMRFKAFKGVDRTLSQVFVPPILMSQSFENLMGSTYEQSNVDYKNVALVAGEGEGTQRVTKQVGSAVGKKRFEIFVDARELQSEKEDGQKLTPEEYEEMLNQKGEETLSELPVVQSFSCDINTRGNAIYGVDFFLGDKVSVNDEQSSVATDAIVTEAEHTYDSEGYSLNLTFGFGPLTLAKKMRVLGVI